MKLRRLSFLGMILLALFVFIGHVFFSNSVIDDGFGQIEKNDVFAKLHSGQKAVEERVVHLSTFVWDWSSWDDTYAFVQDENAEFVESNLVPETFLEQNLSAVIVRNSSNRVVYARSITPDGRDDADLLQKILSAPLVQLPPIDSKGEGRGGLLLLDGGLFIVAERRILTSDGNGPAMGTLIMVRQLSPAMIAELSDILGYPIQLEPILGRDDLVSHIQEAANGQLVEILDADFVRGSLVLLGTNGHPVGVLRVTVGRQITQYGHRVQFLNGVVVALSILFFCLLAYLLLQRNILGRLESLDKQVSAIRESEWGETRVVVGGNDEISELGQSINAMLKALEGSHYSLVEKSAAIEENERFLLQVLNSISVGILLVDPERRTIVEINDFALEMSGWTRDEAVGKVCHNVCCPAEKDNCPILDLHQSRDFSKRKLLTKDGGEIPIMKSASFVNKDGRKLLLETVVDITEIEQARIELERVKEGLEETVVSRTSDLEQANRELIASDKARTLFLSSASHELRTPLTSVLGFVKLMEKNFNQQFLPYLKKNEGLEGKTERFADNLNVVRSEAERLGRLVNDLLDLNKIGAGHMEWRDQALSVKDLLTTAGEACVGLAAEQDSIEFFVDLPMEDFTVFADRDRLQQVLINLLSNAFKYTESGYVRTSVVLRGDVVEFSVCDSGSGIPEEDRERIFDIFYQVQDENMRSSAVFGTGLGLAICRQIVSHYNGSICVNSTQEGGSCFVFTIPAIRLD